MRVLITVFLILTIVSAVTLSQPAANPPRQAASKKTSEIDENEKIWKVVDQSPFFQITDKPYHVGGTSPAQCAPAFTPQYIPQTPHDGHWIHVYITANGTNAMITGKGVYPEGTMILKQKFSDPAGVHTELYTGMRKRESSYNKELGDWEFFILDAKRQVVTARGRIDSCMDCHSKFEATDFVSRQYLAAKPDGPQK